VGGGFICQGWREPRTTFDLRTHQGHCLGSSAWTQACNAGTSAGCSTRLPAYSPRQRALEEFVSEGTVDPLAVRWRNGRVVA
jgi:hypothetical protein